MDINKVHMLFTIITCVILFLMLILYILMFLWVVTPSVESDNINELKIFSLYTSPFVNHRTIEIILPNQNKCVFEGNLKESTLILLLTAQSYYEKNITQYLIGELSKYDMFIDIGANEGYYSILAKKLIDKIEVLAFEPSPNNVQQFKEHIKKNQLQKQIELYECAVGEKEEILEFKEFALSGMLTSGTKDQNAPSEKLYQMLPFLFKTFKTKCIPLDSIQKLSDKTKRKLFKIDVEGAEHSVLLGMKKILQTFNATFIVEITPNEDGANVFDLFFQEGYEAYDLENLSKKISPKNLPKQIVNVLFIRRS